MVARLLMCWNLFAGIMKFSGSVSQHESINMMFDWVMTYRRIQIFYANVRIRCWMFPWREPSVSQSDCLWFRLCRFQLVCRAASGVVMFWCRGSGVLLVVRRTTPDPDQQGPRSPVLRPSHIAVLSAPIVCSSSFRDALRPSWRKQVVCERRRGCWVFLEATPLNHFPLPRHAVPQCVCVWLPQWLCVVVCVCVCVSISGSSVSWDGETAKPWTTSAHTHTHTHTVTDWILSLGGSTLRHSLCFWSVAVEKFDGNI